MTEGKTTIEKRTTTSVQFDHEEVKAILLRAAGAPAEAERACDLRDEDGDAFYCGLEIVWHTVETVEK